MNEKVLEYAKFIVAAVGITATTLVATIPEGTTVWHVVTILGAVATALGVLFVPNRHPVAGPEDA